MLPLIEDLVVQFSDEVLDDLVELIIQGFSNRAYPIKRENRNHIQKHSRLQRPVSFSTAPSPRRLSLWAKAIMPAMSEGEGST